jgi:hypothetical protein
MEKTHRAQSSLEFLVFASISIFILLAAVTFFGIRADEVSEMKKLSQMKEICVELNNKISAVFANGDGASAHLDFPGFILGNEISISVSGSDGTIGVSDGINVIGCPLSMQSVSNGTSSTFTLASNATIRNSFGVILVE